MSALAKRCFIWILLFAVSLQGTAAVIAALQGPAHFHAAMRTPAAPPAQHAHDLSHPHHAHQSHDQVRRHYHLPGSDAVRVPDHVHDDIAASAERTNRGEYVSAPFLAVISDSAVFIPTDQANSIAMGRAKKLLSCIPRRIERPPRLPAA